MLWLEIMLGLLLAVSAAGILLLIKKRNSYKPAFYSLALLGVFSCSLLLFGFRNPDHAFSDEKHLLFVQSFSHADEDTEPIRIKEQILIDAPVVPQLPELPRGCEVTSLAMLLGSAGVEVDKMVLAEQVKRDPAPRIIKDGVIHFGNPHKGFVGSMYTFDEPGLGVYHEPIMELAQQYLPGKMVNLSGQSFDELKIPLSESRPVWVIINAEYRELDESYFQTWHTSDGPVKVTMKEHSVLITGYDREYIYFNDPLTGQKNKKAPISDFEKSWVQMGSQALTYQLDQ
ncbi:MAG TPA: C39 family peptidase [Bacillaceae bacterium]